MSYVNKKNPSGRATGKSKERKRENVLMSNNTTKMTSSQLPEIELDAGDYISAGEWLFWKKFPNTQIEMIPEDETTFYFDFFMDESRKIGEIILLQQWIEQGEA